MIFIEPVGFGLVYRVLREIEVIVLNMFQRLVVHVCKERAHKRAGVGDELWLKSLSTYASSVVFCHGKHCVNNRFF